MSGKTIRRRRARLMQQDPHCFWCRRALMYVRLEQHQRTPADFPTIDHINSRLMYPQGRPQNGKWVLACPDCNQARNKQEHLSLPKEELWERSKRHPTRTIEPSSPLLLCSPTEKVRI